MKKFIPLLVSVFGLLGAGCATRPDPLAVYYQAASGQPVAAPLAPSGFTRQIDGITFYYGTPTVPATILGQYSRPNLRPAKLARSARYHGADAVWITADPARRSLHPHVYLLQTIPSKPSQ